MSAELSPARRGLMLVHTGDGKGKTTAALGLALRALGHGMRVLMIQFVKADEQTGEHKMAERLGPQFVLRTMGAGFVIGEWSPEDIAAVREAWQAAKDALASAQWDMVILDEVMFPLSGGVLDIQEVLQALAQRPPTQHLVLTGRDAPPALVAAADLVTDMRAVKHPFDAGIGAQPGIEF